MLVHGPHCWKSRAWLAGCHQRWKNNRWHWRQSFCHQITVSAVSDMVFHRIRCRHRRIQTMAPASEILSPWFYLHGFCQYQAERGRNPSLSFPVLSVAIHPPYQWLYVRVAFCFQSDKPRYRVYNRYNLQPPPAGYRLPDLS